jgi:hypothetical protein
MKIFKNNRLIIVSFIMIISLSFFTACEEGPNFRIQEYPEQTATGISPAIGYPGINVTITGTDFGTLKGAVKVYFGGVLATNVVSCEDTKIVVQVPAGAISGDVSLQIWKHTNEAFASFTVLPAPEITSVASNNATNSSVAFPGIDVVTINGVNFGTDASKIEVKFNGTLASIDSVTDDTITVTAPEDYQTGFVSVTIGGLELVGSTAIINPTAPGDITPYFMGNTGVIDAKGGGFVRAAYDGSRWGTLAAPWITNAAGLNKGNGIGGYGREPWNGRDGFICWETWGDKPVVDGTIYQPTSMALPAGSYTLTLNYYGEIQTDSSVDFVVAAGGNGIPLLADISTALASVTLYNGTTIGDTKPNFGGEVTLDFTLGTSQVVSIGFLGNLKGRATKGNYFLGKWIKLVKN